MQKFTEFVKARETSIEENAKAEIDAKDGIYQELQAQVQRQEEAVLKHKNDMAKSKDATKHLQKF